MSWTWAALMPHPPVIVPEVGRGRENEAHITQHGLKQLVDKLSVLCNDPASRPDVILILSPHQPYVPNALCLNASRTLEGNLAPFGAPDVAMQLKTPQEELQGLYTYLDSHNFPLTTNNNANLTHDHGSLVPLFFIRQCFPDQKMPPVIIGSPIGLSIQQAFELGKLLASYENTAKWAFIASGDLSHRLTPNAPAGYNPAGKVFDATIVRALRNNAPELLMEMPQDVVQGAGECGFRSVMTLLGLCQEPVEVLSYEGPFGVGYCTAFWSPDQTQKATTDSEKNSTKTIHDNLPHLARETIRRYLAHEDYSELIPSKENSTAAASIWQTRSGCFVTIKTKQGDLRGCMGTFLPVQKNLGLEIISNAIMAAVRDPRFSPLSPEELDSVVLSVDVLGTPESVSSLNELDPQKWGVIVTQGQKRGLLLPALEGVTTVEQQLGIAAQKGGISDWNNTSIQRFSVTRHLE